MHYFDSFDKKLPVKGHISRKTASAALPKTHSFAGDIWIILGMIRRAAILKNTSGELFLPSAYGIHKDEVLKPYSTELNE